MLPAPLIGSTAAADKGFVKTADAEAAAAVLAEKTIRFSSDSKPSMRLPARLVELCCPSDFERNSASAAEKSDRCIVRTQLEKSPYVP